MELSSRDIAYLVWLGAVAVGILLWRPGREAIREIAAVLRGKLLGILLIYGAYYVVVIAVAEQYGLWNPGMVKDTAVWFVLAGVALLFSFTKPYRERDFFRGTIWGLLRVSTIVEFLIGVTSLSLTVELLAVPLFVLLALLAAAAGTKPELHRAKTILQSLLGVAFLLFIGASIISFVTGLATADGAQLARLFLLPIWSTVASLPFVYLFSLYANYEPKVGEIDRTARNDRLARWRAKALLYGTFRFRNRELGMFAPIDARELAEAKDWGAARRVLAFKRARIRLRMAREEHLEKRLARFAGVDGTDWDGRPLDRREFKETQEALDRLAAFHAAQFRDGRYRAELMSIVGGLLSKAIPESEIVMVVHPKGRSWYGWRRTVTGWHIGIGAARPPPDRWVYEAQEAPAGFPRRRTAWTQGDFPEERDDIW